MHRILQGPLKGLRLPSPKSAGAFALRYLTAVTFAIWFGGFTFYSAVVVPDLHESLGGMETGEISRRVSVVLNMIGGAAVSLGWLRVALDREARSGWRGLARLGLLALTTALLLALAVLHRHLGARLDAGGSLSAFRPIHEFYLILSTVQWVANLGLIAIEAASCRGGSALPSAVDRRGRAVQSFEA